MKASQRKTHPILHRLTILLTVLLCFALSMSFAFGEKSIEEVNEDIDKTQEEIDKQKEEEEKLKEEMSQLDSQIQTTQAQVDSLSAQVANMQVQLNDNQLKLEKKAKELQENNQNLNGRLRNMYKNGAIGFIDVILSSDNVTDLINNFEMVGRIYSGDKDVVAAIEKEYNEIKEIQDSMSAQKEEMDDKVAQLVSKQKELSDTYASVKDSKENVSAKIDSLQTDLEELHQEAANIWSYSSNVEYSGSNSYSGSGSGYFIWPVPSSHTISSYFGYRQCPYHGPELHSGIDIPAPGGNPVVAAADGLVVAATWMDGLGNAVVISHGNGLYSVYGHNSGLNVAPGQTVKQGDTVAFIGSTGNSTGNHCHFEVRVGGEYGSPVNPMDYL